MQVTASVLAQLICDTKVTAGQVTRSMIFDLGARYNKMPFPLPTLVVEQNAAVFATVGMMTSRLKGIEIHGNLIVNEDEPCAVVMTNGSGEYIMVSVHAVKIPPYPNQRGIEFYVCGPRQAVSDNYGALTEQIKEVIAYIRKHFKQYIVE